MSTITDYASLQTNVLSVANRSGDTDLTAQLPMLIQLAEVQIGQDVRRTSAIAQYTFNDVQWPMPAAIKELKSIRLVTGSPALDLPITITTPEMLDEMRAVELNTAGRPTMAMIVGRTVVFDVTPDQAYTGEVTYIASLSALSDANPTNTVLDEAPNIYVYATMVEVASYLEYADAVPLWQARYDAAVAKYNKLRTHEEYGPSLRPARVPRIF